jgi:hypothetical protein
VNTDRVGATGAVEAQASILLGPEGQGSLTSLTLSRSVCISVTAARLTWFSSTSETVGQNARHYTTTRTAAARAASLAGDGTARSTEAGANSCRHRQQDLAKRRGRPAESRAVVALQHNPRTTHINHIYIYNIWGKTLGLINVPYMRFKVIIIITTASVV